MSTHLTEQQIADYVSGDLVDEARTAVMRHLTFCETCRERVARHREAERGVVAAEAEAKARATDPAPPRRRKLPPAAEDASLLTDRREDSAESAATKQRKRRRTVTILAAVALAVLIGALLWRARDTAPAADVVDPDALPQPISLAAAERPWLDAPGWGRARLIGVSTLPDPVHVTLDDAGNAYALLVAAVGDASYPYVVALDRTAETRWTALIDDAPLSRPDTPKIVWDGARLHLFWLSDERLFTAQVDTAGAVTQPTRQLSGDAPVGAFDVVAGPDNAVTLWYSGTRRDPGLFALAPGMDSAEALLVDPDGFRPSLRYDADGTLHALWIQYPAGFETTTYLFGSYPGGTLAAGSETIIRQRQLGTNKRLEGPVLGIESATAYVFWTERTTTGPSAGDIDTYYLTFPTSAPAAGEPLRIAVPSQYDLAYTQPQGPLVSGERVPLQPLTYPSMTAITHIATNPAPEAELAIAYRAEMAYLWRNTQAQINAAFLQNGDPTGHQLLTFSSGSSTSPFIRTGNGQSVLSTWVEQGNDGGWLVYFATSEPQASAVLQTLDGRDVAAAAGNALFGMLSGLVLAPIVVPLWMIIPVLVLFALTRFTGGTEGKLTAGGIVVCIVFVALTLAIQIGSLPTGEVTPFAAWVPFLPAWLASILRVVTPFVVAAIALLLAYYATYVRGRESLFYFMLLFAALSGVMMMALYGSWFLGAL